MPTPAFVRSAVLGLLALAAAPAAHAQQHPRYQVEASLDQTGSHSMYGVIAEGTPQSRELSQVESVGFSFGASRLARIAPRTSLRFGLSLADKGYAERSGDGAGTTLRHVDILYLGAPVTVGYNLVNPRPGVKPFIEAGVAPELLVARDESQFDFDLRRTGISYLVNAGVKYGLPDGRALVLAPEARIAARKYSVDRPGARPSGRPYFTPALTK
jgi:hypothetical protein